MWETESHEEPENLGNIIGAIKAQISAFKLFHGENPHLDFLLNDVKLILEKQNCWLDSSENVTSAFGTTALIKTSANLAMNQEPNYCSAVSGGCDEEIQNRISEQMRNMRIALKEIKLHGSAFQFFASEEPNLRLFLQNLDIILTKYPTQSTKGSQVEIMDLTPNSNTRGIELENRESASEFSVLNRGGGQLTDWSDTHGLETVTTASSTDLMIIGSGTYKRKLSDCSVQTNYDFATKKHRGDADADSDLDLENIQNGDGDDDDLFLPIDKVLATDLVMTKILSHLTVAQLKLCRQICWRFNVCAVQALRQHDSFKVKFKYDWNSQTYFSTHNSCSCIDDNSESEYYTLGNFTRFLNTCSPYSHFPCESFMFTGGTLECKDLRDFFFFYGKKVKKLYLDLFCFPPHYFMSAKAKANISDSAGASTGKINHASRLAMDLEYPSIYCLKTLLVCRLPELESLELHNFPHQWRSSYDRLFPEPKGTEITLKNLRHLNLGCDAPLKVSSDLLRAAINLRQVDSSLSNNFGFVLKAKRFHLIHHLMWRPCLDDIELYEQIANSSSRVPLKYFGICLDRIPPNPGFLSRVSNVVMKLAEAGSLTLNEFCIASSLGSLSDLCIPRLEKVKSLKVGKFGLPRAVKYPQMFGLSEVYFPPGFQFTDTFPNLTCVRFHFYDLSSVVPWKDCFGNYREAPSVRSVVFENTKFLPYGWLAKFAAIFPNVEYLEIKASRFKFVDNARVLWGLRRLREVKFNINLNLHQNNYPALDSAFTGFSKDTCINLLETSEMVDLSTVSSLRENPSIIDRQGLELMHITFVDLTSATREEYPPIMTHVTSLFAFQMCPRLKIFFRTKVNNKENIKKLRHAVNPLLYKYSTQPPVTLPQNKDSD